MFEKLVRAIIILNIYQYKTSERLNICIFTNIHYFYQRFYYTVFGKGK